MPEFRTEVFHDTGSRDNVGGLVQRVHGGQVGSRQYLDLAARCYISRPSRLMCTSRTVGWAFTTLRMISPDR